jgi:hypothetical protein
MGRTPVNHLLIGGLLCTQTASTAAEETSPRGSPQLALIASVLSWGRFRIGECLALS